jgi:hypothetical protein
MTKSTDPLVAHMKQEVTSIARDLKVLKSRAFSIWFGRVVLNLNDDEALDATTIEGANDKGIDLFYIDHDDGKIIIVQAKHSDDGKFVPKIKDVDHLRSCLDWLSSPSSCRSDGRADLAAAAEDYLVAVKEGYGTEMWFVYAGPKCPNIEKHIAVYNQNQENMDVRRACRNCDIGLLNTYFEEYVGGSKRLASETIKIVDSKHFQYDAEFGSALVATVPASELIRLYKKYEDRLFDRNVRLFLGSRKGSVNAVIAETLRSDEKSYFWAYNNGLTLVCTGFDVAGDSVTVRDFCIVNGCQSTRSLVDNEATVNSSVNALVRILAVQDALVDDVIRFTNSQNPIRAWDLASQNRTQRRLKREFDELNKPYHYITRRGDQLPGKLGRYKNGGKPRIIKLSEVGQYMAAIVGQPVLAYKNKAFVYTSRHDEVFPQDVKVEEVLFASVCGEEVAKVVHGHRKANDCTPEDERILIKGGSFFVVAVLGEIAKLRNGTTYLKQLSDVQITSKLGRDRVRKYAKYALLAYLRGVKDALENSSDELPTLIRAPQFFERVRDRVKTQYRKEDLAGNSWLTRALPKLV